jgi:hypothetical protein
MGLLKIGVWREMREVSRVERFTLSTENPMYPGRVIRSS